MTLSASCVRFRQAAAFEFKIELETRKAMKDAANLLPRISPERQRDELFKIWKGPKPDASMRALEMLGVLPYLLPELPALKGVEQSPPHIYDVWEHTLSVLGHLENILAPWLRAIARTIQMTCSPACSPPHWTIP